MKPRQPLAKIAGQRLKGANSCRAYAFRAYALKDEKG